MPVSNDAGKAGDELDISCASLTLLPSWCSHQRYAAIFDGEHVIVGSPVLFSSEAPAFLADAYKS